MSTSPLSRLARGAALCTVLALTACGGLDKPESDGSPGGGTTPPPVAANDSFFDYVMARVGALIDNEEPASIDGVTETKPEDTEPKPVG
ncbi:hypothetical protein [Massilia sp. Mn16-1_5]|uniref:hypothetical protein n=1 Tax=Massilia sp. Mn16-1_5 TaxID=2079199 RepID=UPI00109E9482|nr:hypothetical protein [Massilia sp. Mn16-1_5]THC45708.1 hypothetical protein C2862_04280 [Massilia sp. Mn16-1_5]